MEWRWWSRPTPSSPLDHTLRAIVMWFRLLGLAWMALLVALTFVSDHGANAALVSGALGLAIVWSGVTVIASSRPGAFGSWWFLIGDVVVVLAVGAASTVAGAEDLFHGGFLMSGVVVGAYAYGLAGGLAYAALLTVEQVVVHLIDDKGWVATGGNVIFFIVAFIVGWTFDSLRQAEDDRRRTLDELERERTLVAIQSERARLADQMHDTVLQTLHAIRLNADDAEQTRYLARRQERELRRSIAGLRSSFDESYRVELLAARDEVEDAHTIVIDAVIRNDASMTPELRVVVESSQEAMRNAAMHSGAATAELFSEEAHSGLRVYVRDGGSGFDVSRVSTHRGIGRCRQRLQAIGGDLEVTSTPGRGTEVLILGPQR